MTVPTYDKALMERATVGRPIRVGLIGAGNLARMLTLHLVNPPPPGIRLVAIANRTPSRAEKLIGAIGASAIPLRRSDGTLSTPRDDSILVSDDAHEVASADFVDVIVDATGSVDHALQVALDAIAHRKHLVLANAELDSTLGPWLKNRAEKAGVIYTNIDGDEPGVAMNLIRYVRSLGLRPVAAGNLKGMIDPYRTPETQRAFAEQHAQNPRIVTSFADGTKLAMELCILANATGFKVGRPGMFGPACKHVSEVANLLPADLMLSHGLVDYALGAAPYSGAFVVVHEPAEERRRWLRYLKMGDGPFYVLHTPYHLPHIQAIATIARAVDARDATVAPLGDPVCQVIAHAKSDLPAGTSLDGPGGFHCYGSIENVDSAPPGPQGLPVALAEGCTLTRSVRRDERITVAHISRSRPSPAADAWLAMMNAVNSRKESSNPTHPI